MTTPPLSRLRTELVSGALRSAQGLAALLANSPRRGPRLWRRHTVSDLLVAHRMTSQIAPGDRVLDVGCGGGHWLAKLRMFRDIEAVGVDLAPPADRDGIKMMAYDGRTLPFPDQSFDVTLFCYVLHHVGRDHARRLLDEAVRVTRRRIMLLEDSMPAFGFWYRVRNMCHRLETSMAYAASADTYVPPEAEEMFLTHDEWRRFAGGIGGVSSVSVQPLAELHRYAHHTLIVAELGRESTHDPIA